MRLGVVLVRELPRKEGARRAVGQRLGHVDGSEKAPVLVAHGMDLCPERPDQIHTLGTHPVRHEDGHRVTEGLTDGRERDARVPARRLDDQAPWLDRTALVGLLEDVERHPVLDAPRHVEVLGLRVNPPICAAHSEIDGQERRVAHESSQALESGLDRARDGLEAHPNPRDGKSARPTWLRPDVYSSAA